MRDFEYYLERGDVKVVSKDFSLAKALLKNLIKRGDSVLKLDVKEYSGVIFENIYDCFREAGDALLVLEGYKSYSHQASIVFFKKFGFGEEFINILDDFRYKRNSSKYYGADLLEKDVIEIINFYKENIDSIKKIIEEKLE